MQLVTCFTLRRPMFDCLSDHVGLMVDKVTFFLPLLVLRFPLLIMISPSASYSLIILSLTLYSLDADNIAKPQT
jgi:hypothetical protein